MRPTLTSRPDGTAGALAVQFHPRRLWVAVISRHSGADGGAAAALEAVDAAVELGVREDGLDHRLAFAVELAAALGREHVGA